MAKSGKQKGGGGPKPVVVEVQVAEPTVSGDEWSVLVTAIVSQGGRSLAGHVQFYSNGQAIGGPVPMDPNGRVPQVISAPDTEKYLTVEAQVTGTPCRGRAVIQAPEKKAEEKKKTLLPLAVSKGLVIQTDQECVWQFIVNAQYEDKKPAVGVEVSVLPHVAEAIIDDTDTAGLTGFEVAVTKEEKQKFFRIVVSSGENLQEIHEQAFYIERR